MIRILILLITLNAIFPVAGFASMCASNMSNASMSEMKNTSDNLNHQVTHDTLQSQHETAITSSQMHCDDPSMACYESDMDMTAMDCDSGCCVSCVGASAALTTPTIQLLSPTVSTKPVSGYINYYTRSISPELQPPLV